jgi:hypothetical protein
MPSDITNKRHSIDSLEPTYSCPAGKAIFDTITDSKVDSPWKSHLTRSQSLFDALDAVSGVPSDASDWHESYDHYFDNLASRLCHGRPLPCRRDDPTRCVTRNQADAVFRLGQFEYSYIYRYAPASLVASSATFGVWIGELAQHLREQTSQINNQDNSQQQQSSRIIYRHNIAHDGSLSKLLSILQLDIMVWPGMGAEVVFELYRHVGKIPGDEKEYYVRVLWGGQVMKSSNPDLSDLDMIPVHLLLAYFDKLVGERGRSVPGLCGAN